MKKTTTQFFYAFLCLIGLLSTTQSKAQQTNDSRILLQGFYWDCYVGNEGEWYNIIANNADEMASSGIDMIWLPSPSAASGGMGYLPTQLNVLSNSFGSESDHLSMLSKLNSLGIEPIADIVINHRNGTLGWADFTNPEWDGTRSIVNNDEVWSQPGYENLPRGGDDTGEGYEAGRDLDHTNDIVRQGIKDWLELLKSAGYKGWRYDLVKGYAPCYTEEYNNASSPSFSVGEFYDSDKQSVQDWVDGTNKTSTAFDFPTYSTIKDAVKDNNYSYLEYEGGASGLIGWSPAQSTTFIENHDTPTYDSGRNIWNQNNVCIGYAYILTHPGTPTIFWPHYYDWGVKDKINELIAIRKAAGVTNSSSLNIVKSQSDCYAAIINDNVAVKLGSGDWSPGSEFTLQTSGNNYAVWTNIKEDNKPTLTVTDGGNYPQGSVTITMSATNDATIYYTLDETEPTILYTESFVLNTPSTIKAIAYNNDGSSEVITNTYTFNEQNSITILWKTDVSNPRLWFWDIIDEGTNKTFEWPGATMTPSATNPGWVEYTINGSGGSFIFSDNGNNQTEDLTNITDTDSDSTDGRIWYDNGWVSEPDDSESFTIYYQGDYTYIYIWDDNLNAPKPWPGVEMEDSDNDGWYEYVVTGTDCINVIFNNIYSQTADLNRCGDGWYSNGSWNNLKNATTPLNTSNINNDKVLLYPNPADQFIYISNTSINSVISFYNATGTKVYETKISGNKVDISHLLSGLYIVRVDNTTHKIHVK